jgi:hypothetical protein
MCDLAPSSRLLSKINEEYTAKRIEIPQTLFESIKCTPLWAERVKANNFDVSLNNFQQNVHWLKLIASDQKVLDNWALIKNYLLYLETSYVSINRCRQIAFDIGKELVKKEIGIGCLNGKDPYLIPIVLGLSHCV